MMAAPDQAILLVESFKGSAASGGTIIYPTPYYSLYTFNYIAIDRLEFKVIGLGPYVVFDDLTIHQAPIPDASISILICTAFAGLVGTQIGKRQKK